MRGNIFIISIVMVLGCTAGCSPEKKEKDRGAANDMFEHITSLTRSYIHRIEAAEDSADWARVNIEFEDSLDKVNFSYPADTDLLLSEDQNDTIVHLTRRYVSARDARIRSILHPASPSDTIDSINPIAVSAAD